MRVYSLRSEFSEDLLVRFTFFLTVKIKCFLQSPEPEITSFRPTALQPLGFAGMSFAIHESFSIQSHHWNFMVDVERNSAEKVEKTLIVRDL